MTRHDTSLTEAEAIDTIWQLAGAIDICMFVTWDGKRQRARPMSARVRRDEGRIYFLADVDGAKDDQLERFPLVTLAFADTRAHDYVVITGSGIVTDDREKIADLWSAVDKAWWDGPEDPHIRLVVVEPADGELWKGPSRLVAGARLVGAALSGAKADFGENAKVDHL